MRVLYGRYYAARDAAVAAHVPDGANVLELCCGPARLYLHELRGRVGGYVALDVSERFVARLRALGVDARCADVASAELPVADVVDHAGEPLSVPAAGRGRDRRMRDAARFSVIVAEPVRNLASSPLGLVARLAAGAAATQQGAHAQRFDAASLQALMQRFGDAVVAHEPIPGGREHLYVLSGTAPMTALPFNRPLRTGGEDARIAAALERGWTGGNGPASEHCQQLSAS